MTPLEWNEIEHELENTPTPKPPADLLAKIQAEIPASEELTDSDRASATAVATPSSSSRRRWLMAASALIAVSASFLAYRVRQEDPTREGAIAQSAAVESRELPRDPAVDEAPVGESPELLRSLGYVGSSEQPPRSREPRTEQEKKEAKSMTEAEVARRRREVSEKMKVIERPQPVSPRSPERLSQPAPEPNAATARAEGDRSGDQAERSSQLSDRVLKEQNLAEVGQSTNHPAESPRTPAPAELMLESSPVGIRASQMTQSSYDARLPGRPAEPNDAPYRDVYFRGYGTNPFVDTEDDPLSTFGLDVDSGSYTVARRHLRDGHLPPADAVRVEEFVNYFDYRDTAPRAGDFALTVEAAPSLFGGGPRHYFVRFNVAGRVVSEVNRTPATLVFVVDVSGSMAREGRLELVKESLGLMLDELRSDDRVGLVIYGSTARVLLEPTSDLRRIRGAIQQLQPGGSTNAEEGLLAAYQLLSNHRAGAFDRGREDRFSDDDRPSPGLSPGLSAMPRRERIYRIILCSDGVANVGNTGPASILERIGAEAQTGIALTTVGFGMGNYNDVLMEQLADRGDGAYAYVDTRQEAERIFVENLTGTLQTIASDAKIQVEFDPETVSRYRLLGYENRAIADEDFRNDKVDAGEIGAGHTVTALYEIKLHPDADPRGEIARFNLRYRSNASGRVEEVSQRLRAREIRESWDEASSALRLASIVGEFAEILKGSYWSEGSSLTDLLARAQRVSAEYAGDPEVAELVDLIGKAGRLKSTPKP